MKRIARDGWRGVWRQPVRSLLLVFTFALGFAMVLMVIGAIEGGRSKISDSLYALGVDVIAALNPIAVDGVPFLKIGRGGDRLVDLEAVRELEAELGDSVRAVAPFRLEMTTTRREKMVYTNPILVTTPAYTGAIRSGILAGRFLEPTDVFRDGEENNVVFDEALARFFEPDDPSKVVGTTFGARRRRQPFTARVVGVMRDPIVLRRQVDMFDTQSKARALTARRLEFLNTYVLFDPESDDPSGVMVQAKDVDDIDDLRDHLHEFFSARGIDPYFHVQKTWVNAVLDTVEMFTFLLHFIWVVALIAVLMVTATIAYAAIEERFGEVAIARVEGARVSDIVVGLLCEGLILSVLSAPIGYAIAMVVYSQYITDFLWEPVIPSLAIWGTPLVLIVVALATYAGPAYRIAKLEPAIVLGQCEE